ncbi:hypothetical protein EC973_005637 [Apophysomyces ossiformis]|uniref:Uncharacterized protein n=1 Tax=Apophysomyces ossiformis TaxID=679940 RepID=A0A8H7EL86_9FUNG|nr:hypothetical protein EC973_005637 [Apophysomyces ossiformis]
MNHQKQPEWTYQLTENLIRPAERQPQNPSILVSSLPPNATVFRHPNSSDADASFGQYIDSQFHEQGSVLKSRLVAEDNQRPQETETSNSSHPQKAVPDEPLPTQPPAVDSFWKTLAHDLQQHRPKQYNMDYHPSGHVDEKLPWWVAPNDDNEDGFYSVGALLFLFGFICPPLWWLGSFWPRKAREQGGKMAERWQKLNRYMSVGFSIILIIAIIVAAAMLSRK